MTRLLEALRQIDARQDATPGPIPPAAAHRCEASLQLPPLEQPDLEPFLQASLDALETLIAEPILPRKPTKPLPNDIVPRVLPSQQEEAASPSTVAPPQQIAEDLPDRQAPPRQIEDLPDRQAPSSRLPQSPYGELAASVSERSGGRAAILFAHPEGLEVGTGMLASLAAALSQRTSHEVLVVDASWGDDSREPTPDEAPDAETSSQPTGFPNVRLLSLGGTAPHAMPELLSRLRKAYQFVLVGASPQSPASLAKACDGVCLVVQAGCTGRRSARRAARRVAQAGGQLWGCVIVEPC